MDYGIIRNRANARARNGTNPRFALYLKIIKHKLKVLYQVASSLKNWAGDGYSGLWQDLLDSC